MGQVDEKKEGGVRELEEERWCRGMRIRRAGKGDGKNEGGRGGWEE